jgi:hypothetical protein
MTYKLKPGIENFEIMSGPDAGKRYARGKVYDHVPEGYEHQFEPVGQASAPAEITSGSTQDQPTGCAAARAKAKLRPLKSIGAASAPTDENMTSEPTEKGDKE